jgi:AraC-like DNA-binding protein
VFAGVPDDSLRLRLLSSAVDHSALENGRRAVDDLCNRLGIAVRDPVIDELARAILPAFAAGARVNSSFLDHVLHALHAHVAHRYSEAESATLQPARLAAWQERRAKELLSERLGTNVSLRRLADECGLSVSHFIRAFRKSTGLPPHQWQLRLRIERAKDLMIKSDTPLSQVALDCGFVDQSHFTRVFARAVGATPSVWRKANRTRGNGNTP